MKPIGVGLILVLVTVATKCDPVVSLEESTARVEEILDTKSQQREPLLQINSISGEVNQQVVKGQQRHSEDGDKLPSVNESPLDIDRVNKRAQRMYTKTYKYLTAEDIVDMLKKVSLSGNIMQSRSAVYKADSDVVQDTSDKSRKDNVFVLALVDKNAPHIGLGLGKQMLSIAADNESESRYTKKALNKYLRRMYRKLRRTMKRYKRKASFRSNDPMTDEKVIPKKKNKKKADHDTSIYKLLSG